MISLETLNIQIYADGADKDGILALYKNPLIKGITTNPTLMRKAGVKDYESFAKDVLQVVTEKSVSLEVLSDEFDEMKRQALKIASWGKNVFVKIPITNTRGESSIPLIKELVANGVCVNITAILTLKQVEAAKSALSKELPSIISIFAGRIADTGRDPVTIMKAAKEMLSAYPKAQLLWASVREILNIVQAAESGCDIVTVQHDILHKAIKMINMDLNKLSLETVQMFENDARAAGFRL